MTTKDKIVLYKDKQGKVELRADVEKDTLWATQEQIGRLFEVDQSVVSRHIGNIFTDGEIDKKSNMQKMHRTAAHRPAVLYSLDIILAVGYRTNSQKAIAFRKWATGILRDYLVKGFTLDKHKLADSSERIEGLHEAIAFIESREQPGKVKGKLSLKLTKHLVPKDEE
jgi:hypothetical protein